MAIEEEMVLMPKADLVDGYNAIREKGVEGKTVSGQLGPKIRQIKTGGDIRLASITITSPPSKTRYLPGQRFDAAGMVVQATYSNGATMRATGYSWTPDGDLPEGTTDITIQYTEAGESAEAVQKVTVERDVVQIPHQSGSLTYTGGRQSPTWSGYDSGKMSMGGQTSGVDAGSYQATFTPDAQHKWPDGSTGAKPVTWSIGKAAGKVTLTPASVKLDASQRSATVSVSRLGDGAITVSGGAGIVSASVSGSTVTITSIDDKTGDTDITVQAAASKNYAAASAACHVKAAFLSIYGVEWDGTATTKWARTDMATGFVDPSPAVSNGSGSSPFDGKMPWSGMQRVSDPQAGEMVSIPKYWYKWTKTGSRMKLQIADGPAPGFHVSPAHANRGDGKGERDMVYVGRYHIAGSGYKSQTGQAPHHTITHSDANSGIHGLGSTIWMWDWAMLWTIKMLYLVEFGDWNSQKTIGKGCGDNSSAKAMGYTDGMGYHTGTTQSSRDTYGLGTQYRYIEGLWDNVYDWVGGCYYNSSGLNVYLNPASYSTSSGGTLIGLPKGGWSSAFDLSSKSGFEWCIFPTANSGSETTYMSDSWSFDGSDPCLYVGGDYSQYGNRGLFFVNYSSVTTANDSIGSRSMKLP